MATLVWFLPGFMGSTLGLYRASAAGKVGSNRLASLWGDLSAVPNLPLLSYLALPGAVPPGMQILADGLVPTETFGGYTRFVASLARNMPAGFSVSPYPYDWRLSLRTTGTTLAGALINAKAAGHDNILLGHSMGATLAWAAWAALVDQAQTTACSRIITLGGALYGASATPGVFLEHEASLGQIATLQRLILNPNLGQFLANLAGASDAQVAALLNTVRSWPGLYDLFPDPAGLDDPGDSERLLVGSSAAWLNALVQPDWTVYNAEVAAFHTWLRTPAHVPPGNMSVNIVGAGYPTPNRVQPAPAARPPVSASMSAAQSRRWALPSWSTSQDGDGRCTVAQQSWPAHRVTYIGSQHAAQQMDPAALVAVIAFLQAPIIAPAPPSAAAFPASSPRPTYPPPTFKPTDLLTPDQVGTLAPFVPPAMLLPTMVYVPSPDTSAPTPILPPRVGIDP